MTLAAEHNTLNLPRRCLFWIINSPTNAVPSSSHEPGSGTGVTPEPASMMAKSPSANSGEPVGSLVTIFALNVGDIVSVDPSFNVMESGLNVPVNVASTGSGLAPPMGIGLPK